MAYEAEKNHWLNVDGRKFEFAIKNQFFQELLKKDIAFYNPNYTYENIATKVFGPEYISRNELYKLLDKLKQSISLRLNTDIQPDTNNLSTEEEIMYETLMDSLGVDEIYNFE